jgi:3-oxoacyl-[acyl-carrier protein] reductase
MTSSMINRMARMLANLGTLLENRVALVTGASGGIGAAIAAMLAAAGADVALHYHRGRERAEALAANLRRTYRGRHFPVLAADLTDPVQVDRLFDDVQERLAALHILVNGAGINRDRTLAKADLAEWRSVLDLNLTGVALCCRRAATMLPEGGRIINIASIIGYTGNFGQTNYAAAKAGVVGLTKALAQELARQGVTVNAIAPGFIDTPMTAPMPETARAHWTGRAPLRRFGRPEEVAWAALFLAAPLASYVTGTVVHVNGGAY